jgi:hypothetical protein
VGSFGVRGSSYEYNGFYKDFNLGAVGVQIREC